MARINITLDQNEVLQLLADNSADAFRVLLQETLNGVLRAESAAQLKAQPYERTPERTDSRNGTRKRPLTTRIGTIELEVPRHRDRPFKTLVFENYSRSEAALITTMAEMVVAGVSTAKVGRVMEELCGKSFSKQTVSEACGDLDKTVKAFCSRHLDQSYAFVIADATYLKVRENHRVISKALMVVIGFTASGAREIIGVRLEDDETKESWKTFFNALRLRGLHGMRMFTSDANEGLVNAFQEVYPHVPWQRCQTHFARNIADAAPKKLRIGLKSELIEMFNAPSLKAARARRDEIIADYGKRAPEAVKRLDEGFDDAMTVMELPAPMRTCTRTSNYLERLNKEIKRRANVIGIFPNAASVMRLMGSVLIEENERWACKRRLYPMNLLEELDQRKEELKKIAFTQRQLRLVA